MTSKISQGEMEQPPKTTRAPLNVARFVLPRSARWPHQSVCGDVMQFISCNIGWKSIQDAATPVCSDQWGFLPLAPRDGWARQILVWLHGRIPDADGWVNGEGTPSPLNWKWRSEYKEFRYCPGCVSVAYHSPLHQYPWFTRCFIHPDKPILTSSVTPQTSGATHALLWAKVFKSSGAGSPLAAAKRGEFPGAARAMAQRYQEMVKASRRIEWIVGDEERRLSTVRQLNNMAAGIRLRNPQDLLGPNVDEKFFPELVGIVQTIASETGFEDVAESCMVTVGSKRLSRVFHVPNRSLLSEEATQALHPTTAAALEWLVADATHYELDPEQFKKRLEGLVISPENAQVPPSEDHSRKFELAELGLIASEVIEVLRSRQVCPNAEHALADRMVVDSKTCDLCSILAAWRHAAFRPQSWLLKDCTRPFSWSVKKGRRLVLPVPAGQVSNDIRRYYYRLESVHYLVRELRQRTGGPSRYVNIPSRFQRALVRMRDAQHCVVHAWDTEDLKEELQRFLDRFGAARCPSLTDKT